MSKKEKKIFIIIAIVALILLIVYFATKKSTNERLNSILLNDGFYVTEDVYTLEKQISTIGKEDFEKNISYKTDSECDLFLFNTHEYELYRDYQKYFNGVLASLLAKYSYSLDELTYTYRITSDNLNSIFSGSYVNNSFTCEVTFSSESNIDNIKDDVCNNIEKEIERFQYDALTLIKNAKLYREMKKK